MSRAAGDATPQYRETRLPLIKRARGYRLYDVRGNRIVDLYQNAGAALLGHRGIRLTHHLKNVISRGLIYDLPSVYQARVNREIRRRFPGFPDARVFTSRQDAVACLRTCLSTDVSWEEIKDPAKAESGPVAYYRPFLPEGYRSWESSQAVVPLFPFRVGQAPVLICTREDAAGKPPHAEDSSRAEEPVSPFLLAGLLRSIHDIDRFEAPPWFGNEAFPEIPGWKKVGPYLLPRFPESEYPEVFRRFLKAGYLLSPHYHEPSILPGELSPGERQKMIRLFQRFP